MSPTSLAEPTPETRNKKPIFIEPQLQKEYDTLLQEGRYRITTVVENRNSGRPGHAHGFVYIEEGYRAENLASMRSQKVAHHFEARLQEVLPATLDPAMKEMLRRGILSDPQCAHLSKSYAAKELDLIRRSELRAFDAQKNPNPKARERLLRDLELHRTSPPESVEAQEKAREESLSKLLQRRDQLIETIRQNFAHLDQSVSTSQSNTKTLPVGQTPEANAAIAESRSAR